MSRAEALSNVKAEVAGWNTSRLGADRALVEQVLNYAFAWLKVNLMATKYTDGWADVGGRLADVRASWLASRRQA